MNKRTVAEVVARLYTAAGRRATELDYDIWFQALEDVRDEVASETVLLMTRELDLREHPPSPALFRQTSRQVAIRMDDRWSLPEPTSRVTPTDEAEQHIAQLRKLIKDKQVVKRVPVAIPLPEVTFGRRDSCPENDHSNCGSGPISVEPVE